MNLFVLCAGIGQDHLFLSFPNEQHSCITERDLKEMYKKYCDNC